MNALGLSHAELEADPDFIGITRFTVPFVEARYRAVLELLGFYMPAHADAGLLYPGSGLCMLGNHFRRRTIVEVDQPQIVELKRTLLERVDIEQTDWHVNVGDARDWTQLWDAAQPLWKRKKPVVGCNLGLANYFDMEGLEAYVANIKRILGAFGGMWIYADTNNQQRTDWVDTHCAGDWEACQRALLGPNAARLASPLFPTSQSIANFFDERGFLVQRYRYDNYAPTLECLRTLGMTPEEAGHRLRHLEVLMLTLA
jgi:O-methyltransferase involved in polyketide biosynthesis